MPFGQIERKVGAAGVANLRHHLFVTFGRIAAVVQQCPQVIMHKRHVKALHIIIDVQSPVGTYVIHLRQFRAKSERLDVHKIKPLLQPAGDLGKVNLWIKAGEEKLPPFFQW